MTKKSKEFMQEAIKLSIANVDKVFNDSGDCLDDILLKRLRNSTDNLLKFIKINLLPSVSLEELSRN